MKLGGLEGVTSLKYNLVRKPPVTVKLAQELNSGSICFFGGQE